MIGLSLFEYAVSYCLDAIFKLKWWDYTDEFLSLNGRITLSFSIVWGFGGILVFKFFHPIIETAVKKFTSKVSYNEIKILMYFSMFIFVTDIVLSVISYII